MKELKDGIRSEVRIDFKGNVHKKFRGTDKDKRCENEARILKALEERGCPYVPKLLEHYPEEDYIVTIPTSSGGRYSLTWDPSARRYNCVPVLAARHHTRRNPSGVVSDFVIGEQSYRVADGAIPKSLTMQSHSVYHVTD